MNTKDRLRKLLNETTKDYPKAWKLAESWLQDKGKGLPDWPDYCFFPMAGWYSVVCDELQTSSVSLPYIPDIARLAALGSWRYTQSIYRINPTLYSAIIETSPKGNLPVELLLRMPEWCVYIETPGLNYNDEALNGFFAHLEWDANRKEPELRLLLDKENGLLAVPLHVGNWTIAESINRAQNEAAKIINKIEPIANAIVDHTQHYTMQTNPLISLLLYICSDGVEYTGANQPSNPAPKRTKKGWRLFAANHIRVWNLGDKTSKKLESEQARSVSEEGQRQSISPHIRRAHWHTFYAGPRDSEQREIRVKWIPPLLVMPKNISTGSKNE